MRWLVNYIRQCFCKHDFQKNEGRYKVTGDYGSLKEGVKISLLCKKCGYHKSFWKY